MWEWIKENGVFSGIGSTILAGIIAICTFGYRKLYLQKKEGEHSKSKDVENSTIETPQKQLSPEELKARCKIVFVDDQSFKVPEILKKSGWLQTKRIKDIASLEELDVKEAHILFIDINGVGVSLGFSEEGLGLVRALKDKYPDKKIVIYSSATDGNRFHPAFKCADEFLPKNADPYEFQQIVEQFCAFGRSVVNAICLTSPKGQIISNSIDPACEANHVSAVGESIKHYCRHHASEHRTGQATRDGWKLLLTTDDRIALKSKRVFDGNLRVYGESLKTIADAISTAKDSAERETRRLLHNITSLNAQALQELYNLMPQESFAGLTVAEQINYAEKILGAGPHAAANLFFKLLKINNFMKTEVSVFDKLNDLNPLIKIKLHPIHRVVLNVLYPFLAEFYARGITLRVSDCDKKIRFDYESIAVVLFHLLDNAAKYCAQDSELYIDFEDSAASFVIRFDMISLQISDQDMIGLFKEQKSGILPKKLGLNGAGVGMNVISRLLRLNDAEISIERNSDQNFAIKKLGVPYEQNVFRIAFNTQASDRK